MDTNHEACWGTTLDCHDNYGITWCYIIIYWVDTCVIMYCFRGFFFLLRCSQEIRSKEWGMIGTETSLWIQSPATHSRLLLSCCYILTNSFLFPLPVSLLTGSFHTSLQLLGISISGMNMTTPEDLTIRLTSTLHYSIKVTLCKVQSYNLATHYRWQASLCLSQKEKGDPLPAKEGQSPVSTTHETPGAFSPPW